MVQARRVYYLTICTHTTLGIHLISRRIPQNPLTLSIHHKSFISLPAFHPFAYQFSPNDCFLGRASAKMSAISFRAGILVPRHSSVFRHARLAQRAFAPNPAASRIRGLLVGTRLQAVAAPSRMTTIEQVEAAHPEFIDSKDFDASFAANFAQYQKATTSLDALTARANELQAFLESSSKLDAEIDDNLLVSFSKMSC